jgi:hypothetical protein
LEWLEGTPLTSYRIPGVDLGGVVGGSSTVAAAAALRNRWRWPDVTTAAGAVLAGWVLTEVAMLNQPEAPTPVEYVCLGVGLAEIGLGIAGRRLEARRWAGAAPVRTAGAGSARTKCRESSLRKSCNGRPRRPRTRSASPVTAA